ncbi:hypothetical protein AB0K60_24265 [Thermopolyspora sp. NPDC052614]|uniref:hypothetical protein n=1 Tax=Thermopolyspora sp. NPDC052614 TaxID=3155682 RepID=UPI003442DD0A
MAMPRNIRALWLIVGAALTVITVLLTALGIWSEFREPRDYDYAFPGTYGASLISERSQETTTTVYEITSPVVIVDVTGPVGVRVTRGEPDRLTIRRELTYGPQGREFSQQWLDGKVLHVLFICPGPRAGAGLTCTADYSLTVPPDVKVMIAGPRATHECRLSTAETVCRTPTASR